MDTLKYFHEGQSCTLVAGKKASEFRAHLSGAQIFHSGGKIVLNVRKQVICLNSARKKLLPLIFSPFMFWPFRHLDIMRKSFGGNPFLEKINKPLVGLIEHFTHVTQ